MFDILLNQDVLKSIYKYLNLKDKYNLAITNKKLYALFYNNYPLDSIFRVQHWSYQKGQFLYNNITHIKVLSEYVFIDYLNNFKILIDLDVSDVEFVEFGIVKNLLLTISQKITRIYVSNSSRELFNFAVDYTNRKIKLVTKINPSKRPFLKEENRQPKKRIRTPSPIWEEYEKEYEKLLLKKSRMKFALLEPDAFIPFFLFKKFPELKKKYKFVPENFNLIARKDDLESDISLLKDLCVNSFLLSKQHNWVLITQVEVYYKDRNVDDVAIVSRTDIYPNTLTIGFEKFQEGRGTWYELRLCFKRFEIIVTGGLFGAIKSSKFGAFLGVSAPIHLLGDSEFILLSPESADNKSIAFPRLLRNYTRQASLKPWCFKSKFYIDLGLTTPLPLELYKEEHNRYVKASSRLISLVSRSATNTVEIKKLIDELNITEYWKDLGFDDAVEVEDILNRLEEIKEKKNVKKRKLSEAKLLLIESLLKYSHEEGVNNNSLLTIYNGILYPKIKSINKKRVTDFLKKYNN